MSLERKQAVYSVAREFNLTIVEDDPYFFMNLTSADSDLPPEPANMHGANSCPRSFLSLDVDGRVARLDSTSKFLAPGYRIGWVSPASLRFDVCTSNLMPTASDYLPLHPGSQIFGIIRSHYLEYFRIFSSCIVGYVKKHGR